MNSNFMSAYQFFHISIWTFIVILAGITRSLTTNTFDFLMQNKQRGFVGIIIFAFAVVAQSKEDEVAVQRVNDFYMGWLVTYPKSFVSQFPIKFPF